MKKLIFTLFLLMHTLFISAQNQYFVAPEGNDSHNGTLETPFRTIEKAQAEARKVQEETTIYLREGVYRLERPLVFTSEDGGEEKPLTIRPFGNERVVLSGGKILYPEWRPYKKAILKAVLPKEIHGLDMLLSNGIIRHMARYPDFDSTAVRFNGTSADATSPRRVKRWKHPEGGYLHAMHISDWGDFHYRIVGKSPAGQLELEGGWQNNRRSGLHVQNRMVENIFEELDAPGEWFYEAETATLYYYPMPGEDAKKALFETPVLKHLIEFRGSKQHPVTYITVQGIELTQTLRTFMEPYEPLLRSDWTVYRGGAVFFEGTEACVLKNCYLHNLGGNAVFFSCYNRHSGVSGSHFTRIGASAICFVGDPEAVRSPSFEYNESVTADRLDRKPGPKSSNYPAHCQVHDNLIHAIGLFEKQIAGVELSMCSHITISHNSIYDTPRAGINVSEGTWGGHIIEFNDVFDTVKETGDHGSFNSWGRDRFWHPDRRTMDSLTKADPSLILADVTSPIVLRNNRFHCNRGWDIDLDDGSSNYHIYNNLCLNGGIKLREGFYRMVENNIIINNTFHPHVWFEHNGDVFTRNIVMSPYQPIQIDLWGLEVNYNIFADSVSYKTARSLGIDEHSIVCRPQFLDPTRGDYRIDNCSDAIFRCGFRNFDMDRFGVVSPHLKVLAKTPRFPDLFSAEQENTQTTIQWNGLRIKNLNTLGERSATGMDSERGVYVISLDTPNSPICDYIYSNDIILELGGIPVNNLDDLQKVARTLDPSQPQTIVLFRTQKENRITLPADLLK